MHKQTKGVLSSLITDMKAGLITRRTLLKQAACMGLTGSILALLENCGSTPPPCSATNLIWWNEYENIDMYKALVDAYNIINNCGIHVSHPREKGVNTDLTHEQLIKSLKRKKYHPDDPDIISMDIIWTDEFASNRWVVPLNDFWPAEERRPYLTPPIQSSTYRGKIYVAPFRTDIGLMYYRTDLDFGPNSSDIADPTWTWDDLESMVQYAKSHNGPDPLQYGYLWQATDHRKVYNNPYLKLQNPFYDKISDIIINHSQLRPQLPNYQQFSQAIQKQIYWLLTDPSRDINGSLNTLQKTLQDIINNR